MSNKEKRLYTATVLHEGWDMDNEAWVTEDKSGKLRFYTKNHGNVEPLDRAYLNSKILEADSSADELRKIRAMMKESNDD